MSCISSGARHMLGIFFSLSLTVPFFFLREEGGGLDSSGCPRMVGSEKHWIVCRMYLEGCEMISSCAVLSFFFSFNLTISLSLSPDCIRIGCNLSKCLLWLWFYLLYHDLGTCSVPLLPHEREYNSFILPHNCLCLLLLLSSSQASV